ncbi:MULTISPECIES: hypothetical protein [unclassified Bradyrhizobium]|uniref:hypothetical protein n=1 Tax=unclassified Bradyrhizobium TaxID=2631580 RepID=UPI0020B24B25|nr:MULTISPECIES: hypothetical protein [unclassified Bradyrhizobium]MCP3402131.1 hypothetical protein [Bradyrhizobium sp. CCGB20]MCP3410620.1 hypothetical protein [Bradyrhizobium sp. CCGB01]
MGNNFALTNKAEVLAAKTASPKLDAASIPMKPTHVVVSASAAHVFESANSAGVIVQKLPAGTLVSMVKNSDGWALVARDGKEIGYVAFSLLAPIQ